MESRTAPSRRLPPAWSLLNAVFKHPWFRVLACSTFVEKDVTTLTVVNGTYRVISCACNAATFSKSSVSSATLIFNLSSFRYISPNLLVKYLFLFCIFHRSGYPLNHIQEPVLQKRDLINQLPCRTQVFVAYLYWIAWTGPQYIVFKKYVQTDTTGWSEVSHQSVIIVIVTMIGILVSQFQLAWKNTKTAAAITAVEILGSVESASCYLLQLSLIPKHLPA